MLWNSDSLWGRTYREVFEDKAYSQWILQTVETGDPTTFAGIRRLAAFLVRKEQEMAYVVPPMSSAGAAMSDA